MSIGFTMVLPSTRPSTRSFLLGSIRGLNIGDTDMTYGEEEVKMAKMEGHCANESCDCCDDADCPWLHQAQAKVIPADKIDVLAVNEYELCARTRTLAQR
jgi:hypothetical protein